MRAPLIWLHVQSSVVGRWLPEWRNLVRSLLHCQGVPARI
jgi:hypothetical protein